MASSSTNLNESSDTSELDNVGNFRLLKRITLDYTDTVITKWQSQETGLRVVHIDYEGPIINGYVALATEIFDDSGCPHTLEHLIFHGSEQYPYSDALSRISSRYFSSVPNAWTGVHDTVYTISSAGEDSFLHLLPVYVDHILYPQLEQSNFVTEVFHVNGEGQDAGVVYSEMQARQNTAADRIWLAYRQKLYPPGNAYRSETLGLMESLRELDLDQIKKYHAKYYVPHNLCLVVTGRLSTKALLEEIQRTVEARIRLHDQNIGIKPEGWRRPFVETESAIVPQIDANASLDVEFPAKEEKVGQVRMICMGPPPHDSLIKGALGLLYSYLAGSITAPLNRELVDIPSPYCTSIYIGVIDRATFTEVHVFAAGVPTHHLDSWENEFLGAMEKILKEGIDMKRIHTIIDRAELTSKQNLEENAGESFSGHLLFDFMYGTDEDTLEWELQEPVHYSEWRKWPEDQWTDILNKFIIKPNRLVVRGRPSILLSEQLEKDGKKRVEDQIASLGGSGLENQAKLLADSKSANEIPMPDDKVVWIQTPDVNTISWISVQSASTASDSDELQAFEANSEELAAHLEADKCNLPYALHFDYVPSQFVTLRTYISLVQVPEHMKPYEYIFEVMFFSSIVVLEDGTELSEENLIQRLDQDLISYSLDKCNGFPELRCLSVTSEVSKYETAIKWVRRLLWSSKNTTKKLQNRIALMKQSIPDILRRPQATLWEVEVEELFTDRYTGRVSQARRLIKWLPELERLFKEDANHVVEKLESLRAILLTPSGLRLSVVGDVLKLAHPRSAWSENFVSLKPEALAPICLMRDTLSDLGLNPAKKAFVISLANVESSFSNHRANGIFGYSELDNPALAVAINVLSGSELYFWKRIRGAGLAYGAEAWMNLSLGQVGFEAWRSPNAVKAFIEAGEIVQDLVDGKVALNTQRLQAAKNSYAYQMAESVSTRSSAASYAFMNRVMKGRPSNWIQEQLTAVQAVSGEDTLAAMKKYILPVFNPQTSVSFIVCGPTQVQEIASELKEVGYEVDIREMDDKVPWDNEEAKGQCDEAV